MYKLIKTYVVKEWNELTEEEKEKEKEKNYDSILESWQEQQHELFEEELNRASNGAIQFKNVWYNSLNVEDYYTTYWLRDNVKNINFNIDSFCINDLYFESDGKKLVKYNELDKSSDGGYISILPKYKIAEDLTGYVTFEEIEKAIENEEEFKKEYNIFIELYNEFVDNINDALSILDDFYDVPDEFVEDYCEWMEYEYFDKMEVVK